MRSRTVRKHIIIILFIAIASITAGAESLFNYPEGSYDDDIFLSLLNLSNSDNVYYSFQAGDSAPDIPYRGGFLLSAVSGEERDYELSIQINDQLYSYHYKIDKKAPHTPIAVLKNDTEGYGWYFEPLSSDEVIYYGYDEYRSNENFIWDNELILPPKSGFIYYYAVDDAGNRSRTKLITAETSSSAFYRTALDVKSPVEGDFSNPQLLYIEKEGFEWIKYSLNGSDPLISGADYIEPVEIRRYGSVTLKITAKPENSATLLQKEINYRVNTKLPLKNVPSSGIFSSEINIKSLTGNYRYCMEERSPGENDRLFNSDLKINPIFGGVKYSVLRISNYEDPLSGDFRYFYVIDDRYPASPIIDIVSLLPEQKKIDVTIKGPSYSDIFYSLDGSTPGRVSDKYRSTFSVAVPENKNAGSIIIKARSVSLNGKNSEVVSKIFTYDTKKPAKPEIRIEKNPDTGLYELLYEKTEDEKLYYAISDSNETEPDRSMFSEVVWSDFLIDTPFGTYRDFYFIFAAADDAGNWSDYSDIINVYLDKEIPEKPRAVFSDNRIIIESPDRVNYRYTIIKNGTVLTSKDGVYTEPVELEHLYFNTTLRLYTTAVNEAGNICSSEFVFYMPPETAEKETVLFSRKSENIYSGSEVAFFAYPDGINDSLFYYLSEIIPDGKKNTTGPFETDGYIVIKGIEGRKADYYLEVFSVDKDSGLQSSVNNYEFTIDNEKPAVPEITGLDNNKTINDRVILEASGDDDSTVFLNYSNMEDDLGTLFTDKSIIFSKAVTFDVGNGEEKDFYLKLGAGDTAGNSSENPEIFKFRIDKKAPEIQRPAIERPDNNQIILSYENSESVKYYYEIGAKGAFIPNPDENSRFFTKSLTISGSDFSYREFIIKIAAADEAGNFSRFPFSSMYSFKALPPSAEVPVLSLEPKSRKIFIMWENRDERIFYKASFESAEDTDWQEYDSPFSLKYTSRNRKFSLSYYTEDSDGNRSKTGSTDILLPATVDAELAEGIENGSQYNEDVNLRRIHTDKIIRYEISTDRILPGEVNVFSPVMPETIPFRIEEGESIDFIVSLKEYEDEDDLEGGAVQILRFSIDKQPPEPPVIGGIRDGEYYLNDRTAFFETGSEMIYYSVSDSMSLQNDFIEYTGPFDIKSPNGIYNSFRIEAYTQDFSGNKSRVESWGITIDKEIIYVSSEGRDYYEGTRTKPFRTINKALEHLKLSDRKTIFIEEGQYSLQSPGVVDETVTIYGGFKKGDWFEKSGTTEIIIDKKFPEKNPAFYIYGGQLKIENLNINISEELNNSVFYINKGELNISNSNVSMNCNDSSKFIMQHYGELTLSNTDFSGRLCVNAFIASDYGQASINNCRFDFTSTYNESSLFDISNSIGYTITSSDFIINGANELTLIKTVNSSVTLKSDNISLDNSGISATAVEAVDSRLNMTYSKITTGKNTRLSRVLVSEDSRINLDSNKIDLDAAAGIIGFSLTGGNSYFVKNRFTSSDCSDFSYLFLMKDGKHEIDTNIIDIGPADDLINLRSQNAEIDFFNNTVLIKNARTGAIAFKPEKGSVNRIINNIVDHINEDNEKSAFVYIADNSNNISIKNNCMHGWDYMSSGIEETRDIVGFDLIDNIYSAGPISDNILESPEVTFTPGDAYKLSPESSCIDSGYDLKNIISGNEDIDGDYRPNSIMNTVPAFDIGADEYYQ